MAIPTSKGLSGQLKLLEFKQLKIYLYYKIIFSNVVESVQLVVFAGCKNNKSSHTIAACLQNGVSFTSCAGGI